MRPIINRAKKKTESSECGPLGELRGKEGAADPFFWEGLQGQEFNRQFSSLLHHRGLAQLQVKNLGLTEEKKDSWQSEERHTKKENGMQGKRDRVPDQNQLSS